MVFAFFATIAYMRFDYIIPTLLFFLLAVNGMEFWGVHHHVIAIVNFLVGIIILYFGVLLDID